MENISWKITSLSVWSLNFLLSSFMLDWPHGTESPNKCATFIIRTKLIRCKEEVVLLTARGRLSTLGTELDIIIYLLQKIQIWL